MKHWAQIKEKSAGKKRLFLTFLTYKTFGIFGVYSIAFFVGLFTYIFSPDLRSYSKKYFSVIQKYTNLKPTHFNSIKQVLSYAFSLADKIAIFSGGFDPSRLVFNSENDRENILNDIKNKRGIIFIFTHIGLIEALQLLFFKGQSNSNLKINAFSSSVQSKMFNSFLSKIKKKIPLNIISTENFAIVDAVNMQKQLSDGEIYFISGDRISDNLKSKNMSAQIFSKKILLPYGSFKIAQLSGASIYFVSAVREKNNYKIYIDKPSDISLSSLKNDFSRYLEKVILKHPFQFYNFYDYFID